MSGLKSILDKFREESQTVREQGMRFEELMKNYLLTDPKFNNYQQLYLWSEFPYREGFGGQDVGIDLVAMTDDDEYHAIQCKFYADDTSIDKGGVDSFLATSGRSFNDGDLHPKSYTINKFGFR